jgi:hypothetical protein
MKISNSSGGARLALCFLAVGALLASAGEARAQASLSFSGGNNTPFVLTLNGPVSYVINAALSGNAPFFVFKNVGNPLGSTQIGATGSISYSVNGGASHSITTENSGTPVGSITANDLFFFGVSSALALGDVVTLTLGTITTASNVAAAPPAGGNFTTYITDSNGAQVSTNGVPVPEPGVLALLATAGAVLAGFAIRRRSPVP